VPGQAAGSGCPQSCTAGPGIASLGSALLPGAGQRQLPVFGR